MADKNVIMKALDWAYDRAVDGIPAVFESAQELAASYQRQPGTLEEKTRSLVNWQMAKAGTSGFLTGLGGAITLPVSLPANLTSMLLIQTRMIAAVAHMAGYDIRSDQVRTLAYVCMCGNAGKDVLKNAGIQLGMKLSEQVIRTISGRALIEINKKVGFRLFTKFGEKGIVNFGKLIPLLGGIIGGTFDSLGAHSAGSLAIELFVGTGKDPTAAAAE